MKSAIFTAVLLVVCVGIAQGDRCLFLNGRYWPSGCNPGPQCSCKDCVGGGISLRCSSFCARALCFVDPVPIEPLCDRSKCCTGEISQVCRDTVCATVRCAAPNPPPPPPTTGCDCCSNAPKTRECADFCSRAKVICPPPSDCNCCQGIPPIAGCERKCAEVARQNPLCSLIP